VVTALKLGTARVGVKHGELAAVATIEIIPVPNCDKLWLSYGANPQNQVMIRDSVFPSIVMVGGTAMAETRKLAAFLRRMCRSRNDLSINLKTAKSLGIEMPYSLLARADQVVE
jgi:hypothetical protein